jgi:hypothetical protein
MHAWLQYVNTGTAKNITIIAGVDAYARTITDLAKVTAQPVTSSTTTSAPDN